MYTKFVRELSRKDKKRIKIIRIRRWIIRGIFFAFIVALCIVGFNVAKNIATDVPADSTNNSLVEVVVSENMSDDDVTSELYGYGLITSKQMYSIRAKLYQADYVPGTYKLAPSYTTEKIVNILSGYVY